MKHCEYCGKEFEAKRSDAKYCNSTCRSNAWYKAQAEEQAAISLKNQLTGLVSDEQVTEMKTKSNIKINPEYLLISTRIFKNINEIKNLENNEQMLIKRLKYTENSIGATYTLVGTGLGTLSGMIGKDDDNKHKRTVTNSLLGFAAGGLLDILTSDSRKKKQEEIRAQLNVSIHQINVKLTFLRNENTELTAQRSKIPITIEVEEELSVAPISIVASNTSVESLKTDIKRLPNVSQKLPVHNNLPKINIKPGGKIITSSELQKLEYDELNFQGEWEHFFGKPSINFHCVIHGMPGEGKSTFAIQFANYLADNFGPVIYVSGEEGFSKTMKDKLTNNNANSPDLFFTDIRTLQDIKAQVKPNVFNFIFIDSLDNMRINAIDMKELRKLYANSALISISQSTKDGKMRGSNEIVHDSDIAVKVSNGVAKTTKNRFLEIGRTYQIF